MGTRAISEDMVQLRVLRAALRAANRINVQAQVPRIMWRVSDSAALDTVIEQAAGAVIRAQWTRLQFKNAVIAEIQARIAAIVAKYPSLDTTD